MDSFAGSEPREFIPFLLGTESNGQPVQTSTNNESIGENNPTQRPDESVQTSSPSTEIEATTLHNPTTSLPTSPSILPTAIEIIEGSGSQTSSGHDSSVKNVALTSVDHQTTDRQESPDYTPSMVNPFASGNSSSGESIQAYLNRKIGSLEGDLQRQEALGEANVGVKASESEPSMMIPTTSFQLSPVLQGPSGSKVSFLGPVVSSNPPTETERTQGTHKRPRVGSTSLLESHPPAKQRAPTPFRAMSDNETGSDSNTGTGHMVDRAVTNSSSELAAETDAESSFNPAGSTIAQALDLKSRQPNVESSDAESAFTTVGQPDDPRRKGLKPTSRALIKEHFQTNEPFNFPQGHSVIAFTEDQLSSVLKIVADETVKASQDMLEGIIQRTRRLTLEATTSTMGTPTSLGARQLQRPRSATPDQLSDTSGAIQSDDEFSSIGYSFERPETEGIIAPPTASGGASCSYTDRRVETSHTAADSPDAQTLASLKAEAIKDQGKLPRSQRGRFSTSSRGKGTRRPITRSCKIMKEAYFRGMEWTRTFVSGPVDPRWNPYKFYCQICKANISIYGKGAREILRHHSSEKHLRKDQRWRYEYLYKVDPVTKTKIHQVRGRDGKLLSPYQLEMEFPYFKDAPLVEIGQKLPFYDEFMAGSDYMSSSSDNRARVQLSVLAKFLPTYGDLEVLKSFWSNVGVIVNHQALFTDFNWGKERISVSNHGYFVLSHYAPC